MNHPEYADIEERPRRDAIEYLEIPFRYPPYFWVPFAAVMTVAILLALGAPRKYRSATLILVESKNVPEYFVTPVTPEGIAQRLNTIRQVVMSRTRLEQVLQKLDPYPEMAGQPSHVIVEAMRGAIEIRVQGTDSFVIEYVNRDPEKAMRVTNMLASQFTEDAARLRDSLTKKAFDFIQQSLEDARKTLEEREGALRRHKQAYWGSLPEQLDANLRVLQQLQLEQQTLGESLRTLGDRRAALERSVLEGQRLAPSPSTPEAELAKLRSTYNSLRGRYTDDHPDMRALRARMEKLEKQPRDPQKGDGEDTREVANPEAASLHQSLRLVEAEIESLQTRREHLDQRIAAFQARVEQTPRAEQELAALTRDYQQLRENYNTALKKEMDAEMGRRLEEYWKGGYFRVLDPAFLPRRPIRPYGTLFVMAGLLFGLAAGLAGTFIADLLDPSIKNERDLEDLLPQPVLVTIPRVMPPGKHATAS